MSILGLLLGIMVVAIAVALTLALALSAIGVGTVLVGLAVIAICVTVGLSVSIADIIKRRRRGRGTRLPTTVASVHAVVVVLVAVVAVPLFLFSREPSFEEATRDLAEKGLIVHTLGGERPALLVLPSGRDPNSPLPLVLNLHGFTSHYMAQDAYFGLSSLVDSYGFALILPNGARDDNGDRAWNAADLCCGHAESRPDDVAYLTGLVDEATRYGNIDRIFSVGLSNGGWMSYRLACESLPKLAGIVVLSGSSYSDPERCASAAPVSILHLHGTNDEVVTIGGGSIPDVGEGVHPGARELIQRWARRADCDLSAAETSADLDVDTGISGAETVILRYRSGCQNNAVVEYWEMQSSSHVPSLVPDFGRLILAWLFEHGIEPID